MSEQIKELEKLIPVENLPTSGGVCVECDSKSHCPMVYMLREHRANLSLYGDYKYDKPHLWEDVAIDEPESDTNGNVYWCPLKN
jgi:hypothetical protein